MNVPRAHLDAVVAILPALGTPTISDLADARWVAINTVIEERKATELLPRLREAGARGIVAKSEPVEALLKAIEKVHEGEYWIDRAATSRIFLHLAQKSKARSETPEQIRVASLTPRERQTVAEISKDAAASSKLIAQRLNISENTLRNHLSSIYTKLGISSRLELFAFAKLHAIAAKG